MPFVGIGRASKQERPVCSAFSGTAVIVAQMSHSPRWDKELWAGASPRCGWPVSIEEVDSVVGPVTFKAWMESLECWTLLGKRLSRNQGTKVHKRSRARGEGRSPMSEWNPVSRPDVQHGGPDSCLYYPRF